MTELHNKQMQERVFIIKQELKKNIQLRSQKELFRDQLRSQKELFRENTILKEKIKALTYRGKPIIEKNANTFKIIYKDLLRKIKKWIS